MPESIGRPSTKRQGSRVPTGNRVPKPGLDGRTLRPVSVAFDWIGDGPLILPVRRLAADGLKAWQEVLERGYEGRRLALRRRALDELAQGEGASRGTLPHRRHRRQPGRFQRAGR